MSPPRDVDVTIENGIGTVEVRGGKYELKLNPGMDNGIGIGFWIAIALLEAAALSTRTRSTIKVGIAGRLPSSWSTMDMDSTRSNDAHRIGP